MPRQPSRDQIGEAGEAAVVVFFDDLGWGPLRTHKHDLGTDLFVQIRNQDLTDLGMLLGVQVKTGDSWFRRPVTVDGRAGWWYAERDESHRGYWEDHHIPHILLMQDEARQRRFWVRLDRSTIQSTGRGIRVFVPEEQPLLSTAAAIWTDMVAEARKLQSFEGARWNFNITQVPQDEWARYALLASRIVAPHPNQGYAQDINWAEAAALCIQADLQRWDHFASQRENVPSPAEAAQSDDVRWRFAAAIYSWMNGDTTQLEAMEPDALPSSLRTAHGICLSIVNEDRGLMVEAADGIRALQTNDQPSVDQAWLAVHLGWLLYELGEFEAANAEVQRSVALHGQFPSSLINSAIRASGVLALFSMAPAFTGDVAAAVQASDTTTSWWQTQQVEQALNDYLRRSFKRWARDGSITVGGGDLTHNELFSAELAARLAGNKRSARYATYLRAMANLSLPNGDHARPADQLDTLRRAGYAKELALALKHLRNEGPLSVISQYMASVSPEAATTSTIHADLESIKSAGGYASPDAAGAWFGYLLAAFEDPTDFGRRFNLSYDPRHEVFESVAGLGVQYTTEHEERLLSLILELPQGSDQLLQQPVRRILQIVADSLLAENAEAIFRRGQELTDTDWLGRTLIDAAATLDAAARSTVRERLVNGTLSAIPERFPLDELTTEEADAILASCRQALAGYVGQHNGIGIGGPDPYEITAKLALYGPHASRSTAWEMLVDALAVEDVIHERKSPTIELLAHHADEIPHERRALILQIATQLAALPPGQFASFAFSSLEPLAPALVQLRLGLAAVDDDWDRAVGTLLTGSPHDRAQAVELLARRAGHELLLLALSRETDRDISNAALSGLATRASEDGSIANLVVPDLLRELAIGGEKAALHIGRGVVRASTRVPEVRPLIDALRGHESAYIRHLADELDPADR